MRHTFEVVNHYHNNVELELKNSESYGEAISVAFTNYLKSLWDTEMAIGNAIVENPEMSIEKIQMYLTSIYVKQPAVLRYSWLDPEGKVIASSLGKHEGSMLSDHEHVARIINGEEMTVSGIIKAKMSNHLIVPVARGIYREGKLKGIITAAIDVDALWMVMPEQKPGYESTFGIIDKNGMIVYQHGNPGIPFEKRQIPKDSPSWQALNGQVVRTYGEASHFTGENRIGIDFPISDIGWECFVTVSNEEVSKKSWNYLRVDVLTFLLVILLSLVLAVRAGEWITRRVNRLKKASDGIFNGDFSVRTGLRGSDEIGDAGKAFDQMAERIQYLETTRRLFVHTSAHELRNPMTGIKGIASLIRSRIDSGKPVGDINGLMAILENEVDRMSRLLNQIIETFREQNETTVLSTALRPVNIVDIVKAALAPFQAEEGNHSFLVEEPEDKDIQVMGDYERLEGVIRNLLGNSIKYSPDGGEIKVGVEILDEYAVISVKDSGIGIPEDQLEKIFDSFFRSDNLKGRDPGGMGLGLYICSSIVQKHGGKIWAQNNEDRGSTFYIKLPIYK